MTNISLVINFLQWQVWNVPALAHPVLGAVPRMKTDIFPQRHLGITPYQEYDGAELAIINAGGTYTSGPKEAAYSINELIRPKAVIPHHMNEAATEKGELKPGSKTALFKSLITNIPVHTPLSGRTMEFNGDGLCLNGC